MSPKVTKCSYSIQYYVSAEVMQVLDYVVVQLGREPYSDPQFKQARLPWAVH